MPAIFQRTVLLTFLLAWLKALTACAQELQVSQFLGMTNAVADEFGVPLPGTEPDAGAFGVPAVEGDLIQVFHATTNTNFPPDTNGIPHPSNVLLLTTRIGRGMSPTLITPAKFSAALTPRPGGNSRLFARVFNAPSVEESSFYADSQIYRVITFKMETFYPNFSHTGLPLDPNDSDGDGLNNSWEKSLGSDPGVVDTDGDGMTDAQEHLARTDVLDPQSMFVIVRVQPASGQDARLTWDSAVGAKYRVEYTAGFLADDPPYVPVTNVVATQAVTELVVGNGLIDAGRCYRVVVVP